MILPLIENYDKKTDQFFESVGILKLEKCRNVLKILTNVYIQIHIFLTLLTSLFLQRSQFTAVHWWLICQKLARLFLRELNWGEAKHLHTHNGNFRGKILFFLYHQKSFRSKLITPQTFWRNIPTAESLAQDPNSWHTFFDQGSTVCAKFF